MSLRCLTPARLVLLLLALLTGCREAAAPVAITEVPATRPTTAPAVYSTLATPSPDGIGKVYMGREIAQVMGHLGAGWLERDGRVAEERPDLLVAALKLKPTDVVADVGAGTGYFTFRIAPLVPAGKVLAVDIQPEMLAMLNAEEKRRGLSNVETVLGTTDDPKLPADSVDLALLVDAYHEFDFPREMMQGIVRGLKPGGRVALVEYRAEDPAVNIKPHHKMAEAQAIREMAAVGLEHLSTDESLPQQHLVFFRKAAK